MKQRRNWKEDADACLRRGDAVAAAEAMGDALKKETLWDREIVFVSRLIGIYKEEQRAGEEPAILDGMESVDEAVSHFVRVKLLLRRLEFDLPREYWQELYRYCRERQVSAVMLFSILRNNIIYKEETYKRLTALYEENEGKQPGWALDFHRLLQEFGEVGKQDGK